MASLLRAHLRHAARLLLRQPLFTATAVLSLAIGIGANATIFTTANALLLAPIPGIAEQDRVVDIGAARRGQGFDTMSYPTYADIRTQSTLLSGVYATDLEPKALSLGDAGGAVRVYGQLVSASFFDVLGTRPALGDTFHTRDEDVRVPLRRVVLADGFWRRQFAADPGIVGRDVVLNGDHFTIAGVAPAGFQGTTVLRPDLWVPLTSYAKAMPTEELIRGRENSWLVLGARMKPGVSIDQLRAELRGIHEAMVRQFPEVHTGMDLVTAPVSRVPGPVGEVTVPFLLVLGALVGLVLLVACTNLAGLLLARAAGRTREMSVRLALGAKRTDLILQLLAESLLLFVVGAAASLVVAYWMSAALWSMLPSLPVQIGVSLAMDWRVLAFTASIALVAGLLTGLAPALHSSRTDLLSSMKGDTSAPRRQRLRHVLVSAQMGLCLLLIAMAGLFLRALGAASNVDPGIRIAGVDVVTMDMSIGGYTNDTSGAINEAIRQRLAALPGVASVGIAAVTPLEGGGLGLGGLRPAGDARPDAQISTDWNVVSPEFFQAMAVPIIKGRIFSAADRRDTPAVAIINERFAQTIWPGRDPIGQRLDSGDFRPGHERDADNHTITVVGVARDAKYRWVGEAPRPFIYVPLSQRPWSSTRFFVARDARLSPATEIATPIRQAVRAVDPNLPIVAITPMRDVAQLGLLPQKIAASVAASLGTLALLLAGIGLYGVTAYAVTRRTREIGLRMALGADRGDVTRLVLMQALRLTLYGGSVGLLVAVGAGLALGRTGLLFGAPSVDPITFGATAAILAVVSLIASYLPARRAASLDPLNALRVE